MSEETFYRDQILSNAAVLFHTTFRIVLRTMKTEGKQAYEAILLEGETHKVLLAGLAGPGIQIALHNLLEETAKGINDFLQERADKEAKADGLEPGKKSLPTR